MISTLNGLTFKTIGKMSNKIFNVSNHLNNKYILAPVRKETFFSKLCHPHTPLISNGWFLIVSMANTDGKHWSKN